MGKKIISFSLWGTDIKYCKGAIRNCELSKTVYPGWELYFYVDLTVPSMIINRLKDFGCVVVQKNEIGSWHGQQWRYEAMDIPEAEYVIFRDVDSRLNYREKACVDTWIYYDEPFMVMRDHPYHQASMVLGGMWGAKGRAIPDMTRKINDFKSRSRYENDYDFLQRIVLPYMGEDVIVFDEVLNTYPFPKARSYDDHSYFVGEVYDENDQFNVQHREALEQFLRSK